MNATEIMDSDMGYHFWSTTDAMRHLERRLQLVDIELAGKIDTALLFLSGVEKEWNDKTRTIPGEVVKDE